MFIEISIYQGRGLGFSGVGRLVRLVRLWWVVVVVWVVGLAVECWLVTLSLDVSYPCL